MREKANGGVVCMVCMVCGAHGVCVCSCVRVSTVQCSDVYSVMLTSAKNDLAQWLLLNSVHRGYTATDIKTSARMCSGASTRRRNATL